MMAGRRLAWLLVPAAALMVFVYVWPMLGLLRTGFNEVTPLGAMVEAWSLATWREVFRDSFTMQLTLNSLWLASVSTIIALLVAYPMSLFLFRTNSRFRGVLTMIAIAPILVSSVVRMYGWLAILGDRGLLNTFLIDLGLIAEPFRMVYNWIGVTIGMAEVIAPYMILALLAGFGRLDRSVEEAARSLGASPWRTFIRVTLPLSLPAIALSVGLGFVITMSAYVTPKLIGGGRVFVLATEIFEQSTTNINLPVSAVLAAYTLVLMMTLLFAFSYVSRRLQR